MALAVGIEVHTSVQRFRLVLCGAAALLLAAGCQAPSPRVGAKPNLSPHVTDVQTEATIVQMENDYIAAKNSPPPRPEQAAAMKRMQEKEQAEQDHQ